MVLSNVLRPQGPDADRAGPNPLKGTRRPSRRASLIRQYVKHLVVGLIAFGVATGLVSQIVPSPAIPSSVVFIGPKYDYYKVHKDEYNALFFGSSRVYSHILPEIFDRVAQDSGIEVNSYNFGIPAMRALDSTALLTEVLKDPPKNLKWVFFESILDKGYEPFSNARTQRAIFWHNAENTALAARYILTSEESVPGKLVLLSSHLLPFFYHQLNVGRMFNQVLTNEFSEEEQMVAAEFTATEGFYPLTDESDPKRKAFLADQAGYLAQVSALKEMRSTARQQQVSDRKETADLSMNKRMLLNKISRTVRAAGGEPIYIESPSLHLSNDFRAAKQLGLIDTLLSYKDPNQYPQLYRADRRFDADHLNPEGSRDFSQLLAKDFAAVVSQSSVALQDSRQPLAQ